VVSAAAPDELYKNALNDYTRGNYDLAVTGFLNYMTLYPKTSLIPNARYWLGESLYSMKNYNGAIREFDLLVREHPGNSKVASALLKQGYAYLEMGDKAQARRVLNDLLKQFPKSQEAKWAKERLSQVR